MSPAADDRDLLRRLLDMWAQGTTSMAATVRRQPTAAYTDPDRFHHEQRVLLRQRPLVAGLSGDLPHPGDAFTVLLGADHAVVARGEDQVSATAVPGGGPMPAAEAGGVIWVRPDPDGPPIGPSELTGMEDDLDGRGVGRLVPFAERDDVWSMNWKQPYETFLETYHVFALHRHTLARKLLSSPMLTELSGPHGRGLLAGRKAPTLLNEDEDGWSFPGNVSVVYWLFPNAVLSLPMTGHAELWRFTPAEGSVGRTRISVRFYVPAEGLEESRPFWDKVVDFTMQVVTTEDFAQQEAIWQSITGGHLPELVFGRNEPALIHYHESLDAALGLETTGTTTKGAIRR